MKTILVPTDFSKCAGNALAYALELAQRTEAEVRVVYVIYPNDGMNNNLYDAFWIEEYIEQRMHQLHDWAHGIQRRNKRLDIQLKVDCKIGFPVSAINDAAEDYNADLIVMGTTGASGMKGLFLGSTAAGVMGAVKIPVLMIPEKATFKADIPFVFATDFKMRTSDLAKGVLSALVKHQASEFSVVHVLKDDKQPAATAEQLLSKKLGDIVHHFKYLHNEDIAAALRTYCESVDAGMLIVVAHEHVLLHQLFFRSVSKALAHHIQIPMLSLHDA